MDLSRPLREEAVEKALASQATRLILSKCIRQCLAIRDISTVTGLPLASTYRHVHALVESSIMVVERSALTPDGKAYDLYRSRLRRARLEVGPDSVRVEWEANTAVEERLLNMWDRLRQ